MPSETIEEYLETIYKLAAENEPPSPVVRPSRIADSMGVAAPTVTATLKRLDAGGFVERSSDGGVALTSQGSEQAVSIIRRHRLSEKFLVDMLGLPWDSVHEEACRLEHALSPRVIDALEELMKRPEFCPHGHPIPRADGKVAALAGEPLSACNSGTDVRIVRVDDESGDLLGYLSSLGMLPGREVTICEIAPFQGPLLVRVGDAQYAIGRDVARKIVVTPA